MAIELEDRDFRPSLTSKNVGSFTDKPWLDFENPQVHLVEGMRGSGKGVTIDNISMRLYKQGFLILHLWGARSLENLYYCVNKGCGKKYAKMKSIIDAFFIKNHHGNLFQKTLSLGVITSRNDFDRYLELSKQVGLIFKTDKGSLRLTDKGRDFHFGKLLHCKCSKAYPITWIVPEYIDVDEDTVDRYNNAYWNDMEEYKQYMSEITTQEKELLLQKKLKKPSYLRPKPLIIVRKITPPTTAQRAETFREEFVKIITEARDERRIVVMNPAIFEGALDKFQTLAEVFKMLKYLMVSTEHFVKLTEEQVGKPYKYWSKKQKSWHKIAIVINEIRSVTPSNQLSGETGAKESKRAIFDFIPESRHYRVWFIADFQRPEDVLPTIRHNPNTTIVKNGSMNILGEEMKWLFDALEKKQISLANKMVKRFETKTMEGVRWLKKRYAGTMIQHALDKFPAPNELKQNEAYIVFPNHEYKKEVFNLPEFHHKQTNESFTQDTGITWKVNTKKKETIAKTLTNKEKKQAIQSKKMIKNDIFKRIGQMRDVGKKSWKQIKMELIQLQENGVIPDMGYQDKRPEYFSNEFVKWKKKQSEIKSEEKTN